MQILLHTSKTMRTANFDMTMSIPEFIEDAQELWDYLTSLSVAQIEKAMKISKPLADKVAQDYDIWSKEASSASPAALAFVGDIYSGLQVKKWTEDDWQYAQQHLWILSGLYGMLRPCDSVMPYRLEMGYRLPDKPYQNLYEFWGNKLTQKLNLQEPIVNLAAFEYSKAVLSDNTAVNTVYSPKFLTFQQKLSEPMFVVVHAKIARGAFASWLIKNKVADPSELLDFSDLGYAYDPKLSSKYEPVFVCQEFGGKGLSVRISKNK